MPKWNYQLGQQYPVVFIYKPIGIAIENVPDASDDVIDDDVSTIGAIARIKSCNPNLGRRWNQTGTGFPSRGIGTL